MKKRILVALLCLCMLMTLIPVKIMAAANEISVTDATYYDSGALKSITTNFSWDSAGATSRLVLMTNRLRSAGEEGTSVGYGDFTNYGFYGSTFDSFSDVEDYDRENNAFGIVSYTDEKQVVAFGNNTMTFSFDETDIPLNVNKTYYVYLWTSWSQTGYNPKYYPDNLFCVIRVQDGAVEYAVATGQNSYDENVFTEVVSQSKYDVAITPAANMTKTEESGAETQRELVSAIIPVVYTANDGYYFEEDYAVETVNGIMVKRDSETQITVYGTPSDNASIVLTEPTQKPEELEDITFGYAYDVQRSPAYPVKGEQIRLYSLAKPLLSGRVDRKETNEGDWTLTKAGTYSYLKNTNMGTSALDGIVDAVARNYDLTGNDKEGIVLHELKDGDTHIAYGVVIVFDNVKGYAGFIGDNLGGGAGYLLSKTALTDEVTADALMIVTDFIPTINYSIELNPSSTITFDAVTEGYEQPTGKSVEVINTGDGETGELVLSLGGTNADSFLLDKTEIQNIKVNDGSGEHIHTFRVFPKTGLTEGTYTATISVSGSNIITQTVDVTFMVNEPVHTCTLIPVAKVGPTCDTAGKEAYYYCEECGNNYEDAQGQTLIADIIAWGNIKEQGHDWAEATCTEPKTCKRDNCGITEGIALGHTASDWKYDNENHWKECTVTDCDTKLQSASHEFEWKIDREPTETENGREHEECKACGYKRDGIDIPATGTTEEPAAPQAPKTADNSMMELWIATVIISSLGIVLVYVTNQKKKAF
ncbi:MAG: hypothetical protein IJZ84_01695 [Lachnospiraceae bacterium]|nr:hypothetical protein [Lachnospiraceae bacterium]